MTNQLYQVFITALTSAYERDLVYRLAEQGYWVGPLSGDQISLKREKVAGVIIALQVSKPNANVESIHNDVYAVINVVKAKVYSVVIVPYSTESMWNGGNFEIGTVDHLKHYN